MGGKVNSLLKLYRFDALATEKRIVLLDRSTRVDKKKTKQEQEPNKEHI